MKIRAGLRFALCGLATLFAQCVLWNGHGDWTPLNLANLLHWISVPRPAVTWRHGQEFLDFLLEFPLAAAVIGLGIGIAWIGATNVHKATGFAATSDRTSA